MPLRQTNYQNIKEYYETNYTIVFWIAAVA
jgi:hypothetical protein